MATDDKSLLTEGVSRVRHVITKAVYLARGTRLIAKDDGSGNIDPFWQRPDGSEANLSDVASGGGAPTDATYLVETAHADLTDETVVGTTPGGELGGTWASPTVDATHAGSAHHAKYLDSEAIAAVEGEPTLDLAGIVQFAQGVIIEDEDGTPVGDILLKVIDEVLRIRNEADDAYKNVELAELILGLPTNNGILLRAAAGILVVRRGDDSTLGYISASGIAANQIDTQSGTDRLTLGGGANAKRLYIPVVVGDPATVGDGDIWYNLVTAKFRAREDGASVDAIHAEYLDSDAVTAVPFVQYIPFGSEPITGQSYAP